ncbi:hypothetical protein AG1IA_04328 [Rhizoctonia solani AG-1 IA]|uniref:Uncharacterized protein n=1 Tax=Thanatephorus cucumeris (strain AG1-IA) TaxID=983506 RepID=L8WXU0_THACA|nr:hypothetical protein AG1IA_04328 [Rhizoctonia solani AG-1 IA]
MECEVGAQVIARYALTDDNSQFSGERRECSHVQLRLRYTEERWGTPGWCTRLRIRGYYTSPLFAYPPRTSRIINSLWPDLEIEDHINLHPSVGLVAMIGTAPNN